MICASCVNERCLRRSRGAGVARVICLRPYGDAPFVPPWPRAFLFGSSRWVEVDGKAEERRGWANPFRAVFKVDCNVATLALRSGRLHHGVRVSAFACRSALGGLHCAQVICAITEFMVPEIERETYPPLLSPPTSGRSLLYVARFCSRCCGALSVAFRANVRSLHCLGVLFAAESCVRKLTSRARCVRNVILPCLGACVGTGRASQLGGQRCAHVALTRVGCTVGVARVLNASYMCALAAMPVCVNLTARSSSSSLVASFAMRVKSLGDAPLPFRWNKVSRCYQWERGGEILEWHTYRGTPRLCAIVVARCCSLQAGLRLMEKPRSGV